MRVLFRRSPMSVQSPSVNERVNSLHPLLANFDKDKSGHLHFVHIGFLYPLQLHSIFLEYEEIQCFAKEFLLALYSVH